MADLAASALAKCFQPGTALSPAESSALLAAAYSCAALQNCAIRLLRSESARLEKDHEASVAFGRHGVELAVRASNSADGAAALANLVAAAGANKELALAHGAIDALLRCVEDGASDDELCLQACRGLGNLTFGWGVDAIKEAIGGRGATAVVAAARRPSAALFRWAAHAVHNFAVRSAAMQADLGAAGAPAALLEGLRAHAATPRAQEAGCKALAYVVLDHDANRAAAVDGGALEAAAAALRAHAADVAVVEAALTLLCCAVGSDAGAADVAARCGAHTAAIAALTTHCASPAAGELASSALWRLACLTRAILESAEVDRRAAVAAELEGAGVRALFASEATTRRRKVRSEVDACLSLLGDAPAEPPAPPAADGGSPAGDEEAARTASDDASKATTDEAASPSASSKSRGGGRCG